MKRILAISLALIIGLSLSAQIQNKILGFTLGKTTKSQVCKSYKKNYMFRELSDGNCIVFDERFAGYEWHNVQFSFYKGILYKVRLEDHNQYDNKTTWESLKKSLNKKYGKYFISEIKEDEITDAIFYSDDKTALKLSSNVFMTTLQYIDIEIAKQKIDDEESEL